MGWYYSEGDGNTYKKRCKKELDRMKYVIEKNFSQMDLSNVDIQDEMAEIIEEMLRMLSNTRRRIDRTSFRSLKEVERRGR